MRRRLVLLVAAATTTVALAFVVPLGFAVADLAQDRARDPAEQTARALVPIVSLVHDQPLVEAALASADDQLEGRIGIVLPGGTILGDLPEGAAVLAPGVTSVSQQEVRGDLWLLYPVTTEDGTSVVVATVPGEARSRGVARAWLILGGLGVLLVAVATLLADTLARRATSGLEQVEATAGELIAGNLDARAEVADPPEVAAVANALDRLAARVAGMVSDERRRAGDLSHRLRTPMTTLRLDIDGVESASARERLGADLDALEAAVDRLIEDARRPGREGVAARVDLWSVAAERTQFWRALAEDEGRPFQVALGSEPVLVAIGDEDARALLDVLLDNVFTHAGEGAAVRVGLETADGLAVVSVEDGGSGFVPSDAVPTDRRQGSTGLGLDIARRTAERAGGSLAVTGSDLGGAAVRVTIPTIGQGG